MPNNLHVKFHTIYIMDQTVKSNLRYIECYDRGYGLNNEEVTTWKQKREEEQASQRGSSGFGSYFKIDKSNQK